MVAVFIPSNEGMLQTRALPVFRGLVYQPAPPPRSGPVSGREDCGAGGALWRGPLSTRQGRERRRDGSATHFPRGLDAFPDAEETDQPHEQKAESKVPLQ